MITVECSGEWCRVLISGVPYLGVPYISLISGFLIYRGFLISWPLLLENEVERVSGGLFSIEEWSCGLCRGFSEQGGGLFVTSGYCILQKELKEVNSSKERVSLIQFVLLPYLRRAILVSIMLHLSQQLGGINGVRTEVLVVTILYHTQPLVQVLYYSNDIFTAAGIPHPDIATVLSVGLVLVLVTVLMVSTGTPSHSAQCGPSTGAGHSTH